MKKRTVSPYTPWHPKKSISQGAIAYHTAVIHASWHIDNIMKMIQMVKNVIKNDEVVVDFGAGTGSSAMYLKSHIVQKFSLLLVDNSASWLSQAYSIFNAIPSVTCLLLEKTHDRYVALDELIGQESADHVLSANTVHLISDISEAFEGIYRTLKTYGTFTFQSGNIRRRNRKKDILMIHDSIDRVHDLAIFIIKTDKKYTRYNNDIVERIQKGLTQRKFVFPDPREVNYYKDILKKNGFRNIHSTHKRIKVTYKDWLSFLRVKRLQAGILPEVGGKEPTEREEKDRDRIITKASRLLFKELRKNNSLADHTSFTSEWIYFQAQK